MDKWKTDHRGRSESSSSSSSSSNLESYVVQRYLADPYLIGGKKFDLRIYALVTSFYPLECWLYRNGFCRFTSTRFDFFNSLIGFTHLLFILDILPMFQIFQTLRCILPMSMFKRNHWIMMQQKVNGS